MFRGSRPLTSLGRLAAVGGTVLILSSLFLSVGAAAVSAADTGAKAPGGTVAPNGWTDASNAFADDGAVATASGDNIDQGFTTFGFGVPAGSIIDGITVRVEAASTDATGCQIQVRLSDNDGSGFTARQSAALTDVAQVLTLGGAADDWGNVWDPTQTTNGNFRLELRNNNGGGCAAGAVTSVDFVDVQITYRNIANGTANPPVSSEVCDSADFNFVIDMSGSIGPQGSSPSNLPALKAGINDFVDAFQAAGGNGRYSGTRFNGTSASTITSGYVDRRRLQGRSHRAQRSCRHHPDRLGHHHRCREHRERSRRRPEHHVRHHRRLPERAELARQRPRRSRRRGSRAPTRRSMRPTRSAARAPASSTSRPSTSAPPATRATSACPSPRRATLTGPPRS